MALIKIAIIGRLTGPKGEIALRILTEVVPQFPEVRFTVAGGPVTDQFRSVAQDNVDLPGFVDNVDEIIKSHDLVIGAGRVALEAMRLGKPVLAVGECRYIGFIGPGNIDMARASNFGDVDEMQPVDFDRMVADLQSFSENPAQYATDSYREYLEEYNGESVYQEVMNIYQAAYLHAYLSRFREIPVLTYHRVVDIVPTDSRFNVYITQHDLERQLDTLKRRGYQTVTFRDLCNGMHPAKPVILTFDDGYEDNYQNLLPLLKKKNARAVIFALGDRTLKNNSWDMEKGEPEARLMTDEQLIECHASGLIEIGSHGMKHQHLTDLDEQEVASEIKHSRQSLESVLQTEIISFAYPYGNYGDREAKMVEQAGYQFGIGVTTGPFCFADDLYRIRRIQIFPNTSKFTFWKKTSGFYLRYCKLKRKGV